MNKQDKNKCKKKVNKKSSIIYKKLFYFKERGIGTKHQEVVIY